jgi:acyl-CoA synthetase (AMP-forming)/AMP-acid ligase II
MIAGVVREAARRFGDRIAIVAPDGEEITYRDLYRRSEAVAGGLLERGIGKGDVVAVTFGSSIEYVLAYLGAARIGAITAGVNPRYSDEERDKVLDRLQPTLVLSSRDDLPNGEAPEQRLPMDAERPVAVVFTSGTTGEPKGAVFCNRQLAAITMFDTGGVWGGGGPMLASTELAHVGFMTKLPWYLRTGSRIHMLERWRAEDALRTISEQKIQTVGGIAAQIALMLRLPNFEEYDVSAVKAIVVGGGPSPAAVIREAKERFGAAYSVRYSSTESGGVGTFTAFDAPEDETLYTVGRPRVGIDLRISDDDEILLRSPAMLSEYWRDLDATAEAIRDGWLHTGDLGYIDDRGCLRLIGRRKEMFIRGGYNVYPLEVEAVLGNHPSVAHVAVVPRPDEVMGEIGVAVVVPHDRRSPPTLEELRRFASDKLAAFKLPEAIRVVDALPYNGQQKVDRRRLTQEEAASVV